MATPSQRHINIPQSIDLLQNGRLEESRGLLPWGSNYTFLMKVTCDDQQALAIYKPQRGERPLWDFPDGSLCLRETAAFVVSEWLGWHIVPPTVLRDGPQGLGMAQLYIEHDPDRHYFTFEDAIRPQLERIALFDHLVNNADRKGGHCLLDSNEIVWAIDHGICFHVQPKLRTVIWDFAGKAIDPRLVDDLRRFVADMATNSAQARLRQMLSSTEIDALKARGAALAEAKRYPEPGPGRQYPWPPV